MHRGILRISLCTLFVSGLLVLVAQDRACAGEPASSNAVVVLEIKSLVEIRRAGSQKWDQAYVGQTLDPGDRGRTGSDSQLALRLLDRSVVRLGADTEFSIEEMPGTRARPLVSLWRGLLYFFSRDKPAEAGVRTPVASAAIRGTEFAVSQQEAAGTVLTLLDGVVDLSDLAGHTIQLQSGEQGAVKPGQPPAKTAVINGINAVQWCLYYPGVLDPDELLLNLQERADLSGTLVAYRSGDLPKALASYPPGRQAHSDSERVLLTALLLSVGQVQRAEDELASLNPGGAEERPARLAAALRRVVAAVKGQPNVSPPPQERTPALATEWLAQSYYLQAEARLDEARAAARKATEISQTFGFAWARLAELEFSFGRISAAETALNRALSLAPRNAQAIALQGFLLAARTHTSEAIKSFDQAIAADPALANAWLGRGLCRIYRGEEVAGREDLLVAAALEPQRSLLRSYLGKAFGDAGDESRALHELELARRLDPTDPTPWLYSALLLYNENRTAEAIHDLETSQTLNTNRALYRSRLLLDQDQAVRSANLANIFQDAGMNDVSVRESAREVSLDYANFSAHLNLADSFNQLRDPTRFNLRYETEWFNEHLLASLLAPPGAATLSQNLTQQEYSQLFAQKRFGLSGTTEYLSDGQLRQTASQFGTLGGTSYSLDLDYEHNNGVRINNDLDRIEWYTRIKQQLGWHDSALVLIKYQQYESGDNFQYYDPNTSARPAFRLEETQAPLLLAGWHHEWSPGVHTLFLGGRLVNDQHASDTNFSQQVAIVNPLLDPTFAIPFDVRYHSEFVTYSAELNQIFQRERHTDIFGARYQDGRFQADASLDNPPADFAPLFALPVDSTTDTDFRRLSLYAYHHWEIVDNLLVIGGVAYDMLDYPANFRRPSLESTQSHLEHWSPKAGLIGDITSRVRLRGAYSQAVGGVSYDESVRLEPTQLAGFSQSFRSIISESLVGSVEAPVYHIGGAALDLRPGQNTWLSLQANARESKVDRDYGILVLNFLPPPGSGTPANTQEHLDYTEWQARAVLNQVLGREWFFEAQYEFTHSELETELPTIPATSGFDRSSTLLADLHRGGLAAMWSSPKGPFARAELWWYAQTLGGDTPQPPGDSFPQVNLFVGYRFPKRLAELTIGGMNLTGEDYHLSPLNYYLEMPRKAVFYARLRFHF